MKSDFLQLKVMKKKCTTWYTIPDVKNINQAKLAKKIGVTRQHLHNMIVKDGIPEEYHVAIKGIRLEEVKR